LRSRLSFRQNCSAITFWRSARGDRRRPPRCRRAIEKSNGWVGMDGPWPCKAACVLRHANCTYGGHCDRSSRCGRVGIFGRARLSALGSRLRRRPWGLSDRRSFITLIAWSRIRPTAPEAPYVTRHPIEAQLCSIFSAHRLGHVQRCASGIRVSADEQAHLARLREATDANYEEDQADRDRDRQHKGDHVRSKPCPDAQASCEVFRRHERWP